MEFIKNKGSVHSQLQNASQQVMSAYSECSKKEVAYFLHRRGYGLPCGVENTDKIEKIFAERGRNVSEVLTYMSIIEKMVTPTMTNSHTIVRDLNNLGYTVEHLSKKDEDGLKKLDSAQIPNVHATSYAVVRSADGLTGVMAVRQGVIDTKTCPVKEVTCSTQSIPLVKLGGMVGEFLYLKKDKGFMVADMSESFMVNSGALALVTGVPSGSRKLIHALKEIYSIIGRSIPNETVKGTPFACEVEAAITQFYGTYFALARKNDATVKTYVSAGNMFEQAVTGLYNQVGIVNEDEKGVFEVTSDGTNIWFNIVYPSVCMPKAIMGKTIDNKSHEAGSGEAATGMLIMRSRRGKNYTEKSSQTRMLSSPFPLTKEVYEAAVLRTNIEPHIYGYKKLRVHISEEKEITNIYERLFNALYMMSYDGEVIVDKHEAKGVINSSEQREKKVKFDAFRDSYRYGDSRFSIRVLDNVLGVEDDDDVMNILFKHYGVSETSGIEWTSSYDRARAGMRLDVYGKNLLFQVYLTDEEVKYTGQGNLFESVTKHNLTAFRVINSGYSEYVKYIDRMTHEYNKKVLIASLPQVITFKNVCGYYYETILQNVIRSQYNITGQGFIEVYACMGIKLQYLNLCGMRYVKPRTIKLNGMDIEHFVRTGQPERLKEIMDSSAYGKAVIEKHGLLDKAIAAKEEAVPVEVVNVTPTVKATAPPEKEDFGSERVKKVPKYVDAGI